MLPGHEWCDFRAAAAGVMWSGGDEVGGRRLTEKEHARRHQEMSDMRCVVRRCPRQCVRVVFHTVEVLLLGPQRVAGRRDLRPMHARERESRCAGTGSKCGRHVRARE